MANVIMAETIKYVDHHFRIQCSGFGWGPPCRALAGTYSPLLGIISIVRSFSELKVNCYENRRPPRWPNMADHVLSFLPSKPCAATALCSKLIFKILQ